MEKKLTAIALAVFGLVSGMNAGTEVIRDYSNEGPAYNNYAPPPRRPIYYAPPAPVGVVIYPRPVFLGFGVHHRFHPRHVYWRRF